MKLNYTYTPSDEIQNLIQAITINHKVLYKLPQSKQITKSIRIISDHHTVTFDFLHRRFYQIPKSTLHHDLNVLVKAKYIRKLGSTRGVVYQSIDLRV